MEKPGLSRIPVGLVGKGVESLGLPGDVLNDLLGLFGSAAQEQIAQAHPEARKQPYKSPLPTSEQIRTGIVEPAAEALGLKEHLKPQNIVEEAAQKTAKNLPLMGLTGGITAAKTAVDFGGSLASTAAQRAGLGSLAQIGADFLGQKAATKGLNKLIKTGIPVAEGLSSLAQNAKEKAYTAEKELGAKVRLPAQRWEKVVDKLKDEISIDTRLSDVERNKLMRDADLYLSDIRMGDISGANATRRRAELNEIIRDTHGKAKDYYAAMRKPLKELIDTEGPKHGQWYKELKKGDAIHAALNYPNTFGQFVEDFPKVRSALKNPLAYSLGAVGPALLFTRDPFSLLGIAVGTGTLASAGKKGIELFGFLNYGTEPLKIAAQAGFDAIKGNTSKAFAGYNKLNRLADKYEQEQNKPRKLSAQENHRKKVTDRLVRVR